MIQVRNNKRLSLPSSMPKIYAKLKLIILKDSVNSEYFLGEFMVSGLSGPNETLTLKGVRMMHLEWF